MDWSIIVQSGIPVAKWRIGSAATDCYIAFHIFLISGDGDFKLAGWL